MFNTEKLKVNCNRYIPVFLLGMMVQLYNDNKLEGKDFPLKSSVHISSIDIHHSTVLRNQIVRELFRLNIE